MEFIDTLGLILSVIALIAVYYATFITFQKYQKDRARHSLLLFLFFFLIATWGTLQELIILGFFLDIAPYTNYLFIGTTFVLILFIDTISRERIDPIKLLIFTNLITAGVVFLLYDDVFMVTFLFGFILLFQAVLWIYFTIKIYRKSPQSIKRDALLLIIGGILFTLVPIIFEGFPDVGFNINVTGDTELAISIGVLITAYVFQKQPKLAYILPFRASRLTIIDTTRGISIFHHIWDKSSSAIDGDLFGGMMQGISGILTETVNKGNIRQIELEHAILMIYFEEQYPIAFVLLSNEFNKALRLALKQFAEKFYLQFSDKFSNLNNVMQFEPASELVADVFPFIPEYEEPN